MSLSITKKFTTKNPCYTNNTKKNKTGYMQHSTASPGAKAERFINSWNSSSAQVGVELIIDDTGIYQMLPIGIRTWHCGASGNNTHVGCEVCEPEDCRLLDAEWVSLYQNNSKNIAWAVERAQRELIEWGYDPNGVDGSFGPGMKKAVEQFQKDRGLSVDGSIGPDTLHAFQTRKGSLLKYDPEANKEYFENVYTKAVYACAYVLNCLGVSNVNSTNVLSHAEGYKKGIASNHADVGHWWPEHGKSMDDFREDVKTYLKTGVLPFTTAENHFVLYEVKSGDSWWSIAASQLGGGSRYTELQQFNNMVGITLHPGDTIKIPVDSSATEPVIPNEPEEEKPAEDNNTTTPEQASSWAQEAWEKAYKKGCLNGTNPQGVVTREMLAVVLDSLGLLD